MGAAQHLCSDCFLIYVVKEIVVRYQFVITHSSYLFLKGSLSGTPLSCQMFVKEEVEKPIGSLIRNHSHLSCSTQKQVLPPGFSGSEMDYIDNNGIFLLSNGSVFGFGFVTNSVSDSASYLLAVVHLATTSIVWSANANSPVSHSDNFVFDKDGNAYLQSGGSTVWTANISGKGATSMQLLDSGNLIVFGKDSSSPLWQSFSHPTDTLLSGQSFIEGMTLVSRSNTQNMTYTLQIKSGDMLLYAGLQTPQPYWSALQDNRMIVDKNGNNIYSANLSSRSWSFYDQSGLLQSQLVIAQQGDANTTLAAVLGNDGLITFYILQTLNGKGTLPITVPQDSCDMPAHCKPYSICNSGTGCQCPSALSSYANCNPGIISPCNSKDKFQLAQLDTGVGYVGTSFKSPVPKTNLTGCKNSCMVNCSCITVFFDQTSGNCFLFDQIGSLQQKDGGKGSFASFIKVSSSNRGSEQGGSDSGRLTIIIVVIIVGTLVVIGVLVYVGFRIYRRRRHHPPSQDDAGSSEDDEKAHFPSYAFKKLEEGDLRDIFDAKLKYNDKDERLHVAIKVALWCIQEDFYQRPSMSKVVQMLEGVCDVPQPPISSQIGYRLYANAFKSSSEEGTSSGMSDNNSDALLSAVRLSGPR
ncbi:hypothetical protein C2845_PM10G08910 [Panicum miliaceum]|uniref:non-specific serine/threonine protein kinase n=1 Tax=Panicum miliaceum TaxID=4540 RepID=A0A3L6PFR3_PANMI|nr:hypothetical protein C2845_PM10G08910 [Panicum miliaceum]